MTKEHDPKGTGALTAYLAHEARLTLQLVPMYRDMADFQRRGADELTEFLESPEGSDVAQLRAVLAVEVERIRLHATQWDRRAEEAEKFVVTNLPRAAGASN